MDAKIECFCGKRQETKVGERKKWRGMREKQHPKDAPGSNQRAMKSSTINFGQFRYRKKYKKKKKREIEEKANIQLRTTEIERTNH